jgi:hypothetical protein
MRALALTAALFLYPFPPVAPHLCRVNDAGVIAEAPLSRPLLSPDGRGLPLLWQLGPVLHPAAASPGGVHQASVVDRGPDQFGAPSRALVVDGRELLRAPSIAYACRWVTDRLIVIGWGVSPAMVWVLDVETGRVIARKEF